MSRRPSSAGSAVGERSMQEQVFQAVQAGLADAPEASAGCRMRCDRAWGALPHRSHTRPRAVRSQRC
jgi:hypothetical protein